MKYENNWIYLYLLMCQNKIPLWDCHIMSYLRHVWEESVIINVFHMFLSICILIHIKVPPLINFISVFLQNRNMTLFHNTEMFIMVTVLNKHLKISSILDEHACCCVEMPVANKINRTKWEVCVIHSLCTIKQKIVVMKAGRTVIRLDSKVPCI